MKTYLFVIALLFLFAACGEPNHYDQHAGQEPKSVNDSEHDTIQGRAPDSTVVVTDSTNIGIGDTSLEKTPH